MKNNHRVSLGFNQLNNSALESFSNNVVASMTNNPAFATPLVPVTVLQAAAAKFSQGISAALDRSRIAIAERDAARAELVALLRQEAAYVEGVACEDLPMLLSSGFEAASTNRARIPLPRPVIDRIENLHSAQLALRLKAVPTARAYEVRMSHGTNGWQVVGIFTQARKILLENLTPGTTYTVQARAIGGTTGSSDWSDPVSRMSL